MKYIKPPDFKSVKELEAYYKKIEEDITKLLTTDGSAKSANELNELMTKAVKASLSYLSKKNTSFTKKELPAAFKEGKANVSEPVKRTKKEVQAILRGKGFKYAENAFEYTSYIELQTALNSSLNWLKTRVNLIIEDLRKDNKDSVYNVQQAIIDEFSKNGVLTVTYSNGARQPLHAYAAMVARSARIESINIGSIGRALQVGTDYVQMTTVSQCCKLCGAYQGKVYSISGKDKRFPSLFDTVLQKKYALPHPNCRHEFIPYFIEIEDPADVERMIKRSKIKYDKQGNLLDVRFQKDIKGYAEWQAGNRQRNTELLEFERMKKHYAGREEEMPYKTLAGFRRARRAEDLSSAFKAWRNRKLDQNTIERWAKIKDFRNCPKTLEDLQEIKYNKDIANWELLKRERKTISDINSKDWTDTFRNKAIDAYYDLREYGVELTDHGVARFLSRMSKDDFFELHNKPFNYVQDDGRLIKYYNGKALIYLPNTLEVVSCYVKQKKAKGNWYEIKNKNNT